LDWPVKEYLKRHFINQRSYWKKKDKGKGKAAEIPDDIWDFGSVAGDNTDNNEQASDNSDNNKQEE
jgi:hypothetical protein